MPFSSYVRTGCMDARIKQMLFKSPEVCAFLIAVIEWKHRYPPFTTKKAEALRGKVAWSESYHKFIDRSRIQIQASLCSCHRDS